MKYNFCFPEIKESWHNIVVSVFWNACSYVSTSASFHISSLAVGHFRITRVDYWNMIILQNRLVVISWDVFINQNANIAKTRSREKDHAAQAMLLSHFSRVQLCATPQTAAPGSPIPGILQARTGVGCHFLLQCMKVKVKSLSCVWLLATPWTAAYQAPPSMGFSRQEYWRGVPYHKFSSFIFS